MNSKDIYKIAVAFRAAIVSAKYDRRFHYRDRMSNFPGGCCDDSCDLLAYYLYTTYKIRTRQGVGTGSRLVFGGYRGLRRWNF